MQQPRKWFAGTSVPRTWVHANFCFDSLAWLGHLPPIVLARSIGLAYATYRYGYCHRWD